MGEYTLYADKNNGWIPTLMSDYGEIYELVQKDEL